MGQRKSGHVTLLDVARASGFAVSTVSIVLSDAPLANSVSLATRDKIQSTARQLGYHPDAHARSLRKRSTQTIGVLAFDLSDPFCIPIMQGIQSGLRATDYLPLVLDAQTQRKLFDSYLNLLLERRVEGVIVIASWVFDEAGLLADIRKNNVPVLIVGRDLSSRSIDSILVDNEAGGALAMQHLIALKHRKIAVIVGPEELCDSEPRWRGVARAAAENGVTLQQGLICHLPGSGDSEAGFDGGHALAQRLLASGRRFTAVLAFDDLTALGVVRALSEAGLSVPDDCSVIGFDDILPARLATPAMTTIRQPLHAMGIQAAARMVAVLQGAGDKVPMPHAMATPELVARSSTQLLRRRSAGAHGNTKV